MNESKMAREEAWRRRSRPTICFFSCLTSYNRVFHRLRFFPYLCGIDAKLNLSVMARWWMILASFLPNEGQKKNPQGRADCVLGGRYIERRRSGHFQEWCAREMGLLSSKTLSADMMGRTLFRWKLIKWLTLSKVLSLVRTCNERKRMWDWKHSASDSSISVRRVEEGNLRRLRDQRAVSACGGPIAFPSVRTGPGSPGTRVPRNPHPARRE